MNITFETINYSIFGECLRMSNGRIQLTVTTDVGPRIISAGFVEGQNFCFNDLVSCGRKDGEEFEAVFGKGAVWRTFGGHRIWTSPEKDPHSYYPDCEKVEVEVYENGALFTSPVQRVNLVQNSLKIEFNCDGTVTVTSAVRNAADYNQTYAAWALTVLDGDGVEIIPQADEDTGLLANRVLGVWPYDDMSDDRVFWGEKYITLQQTATERPFKIGTNNTKCWSAYLKNGEIFRKQLEYKWGETYPDYGCSFETYTNYWFIEMESLSPLKELKPNETASVKEIWSFEKAKGELDRRSNASIEAFVKENNLA